MKLQGKPQMEFLENSHAKLMEKLYVELLEESQLEPRLNSCKDIASEWIKVETSGESLGDFAAKIQMILLEKIPGEMSGETPVRISGGAPV